MRRTATILPPPSLLNYDQLSQLVTRNRNFFRNFILVICTLVVFVVLIVFIVLVSVMAGGIERSRIDKGKRQQEFLGNLDYRTAAAERGDDALANAPAT